MRALLLAAIAVSCPPAMGCDYPDEGNMPLRRAVTRVQMLPATAAWHRERVEAGGFVTYKLLLEDTKLVKGRCYWTVEALADGKLWRRFHVTPDGKRLLPAD